MRYALNVQWRECNFVWSPGSSDGRHSNIHHEKEGPKQVWLRPNFDQWEEEPMDKCTDGSFEIVRMAPPGQVMFCFVIDGKQGWSHDYTHYTLHSYTIHSTLYRLVPRLQTCPAAPRRGCRRRRTQKRHPGTAVDRKHQDR
jgi:hypothetical protein